MDLDTRMPQNWSSISDDADSRVAQFEERQLSSHSSESSADEDAKENILDEPEGIRFGLEHYDEHSKGSVGSSLGWGWGGDEGRTVDGSQPSQHGAYSIMKDSSIRVPHDSEVPTPKKEKTLTTKTTTWNLKTKRGHASKEKVPASKSTALSTENSSGGLYKEKLYFPLGKAWMGMDSIPGETSKGNLTKPGAVNDNITLLNKGSELLSLSPPELAGIQLRHCEDLSEAPSERPGRTSALFTSFILQYDVI